jgi:hypothetical protein
MSFDSMFALAATVILGIVTLLIKSDKRKGQKKPKPPSKVFRDIAAGAIQQSFEEDVSAIKADTESSNAADALTQRGNSRRRGAKRKGDK